MPAADMSGWWQILFNVIIVVGVVIDTMRQIEAQLVMRNYEGFMN